jgi:hypothetical protein
MKKTLRVLFAIVLSIIAASLVVIGLGTIYESMFIFFQHSSMTTPIVYSIIDDTAFFLVMSCSVALFGALLAFVGLAIAYNMAKECKKFTTF